MNIFNIKALIERENNGEDIISKSHFFWKGYLSNWSRSSFKEDGLKFSNNEQYMMYRKAKLFNDPMAEAKILAETHPKKLQKYGRQVKNFDNKVWDDNKMQIMIDGLTLKFSQNDNLKEKLINTKDQILVEASPFDRIWGIGLNENDAKETKVKNWKGENLLGECLMIVRENLSK